MIPVYAKLALVGAALAGAAFGVKKIMSPKAALPATQPQVAAARPATSSASQGFADPQSNLLPNGQTQAQVDQATADATAQAFQLLEGELAGFQS